MKKPVKVSIIIGCLVVAVLTLGHIPVWRVDAELRNSRKRVHQQISVGEDLSQAAERLKQNGFVLLYEEPIAPTANKDYLQQIVIMGSNLPNTFETIAYSLDVQWMPFTRSESPYVIIKATPDGKITKIE